MRLVTYRDGGSWRPGIVRDGAVADAAAIARAAGVDAPSSVRELLAAGEGMLGRLREAVGEVEPVPLDAVTLGPPIPDPQKIICLGLNYRDHAEEVGARAPDAPIVFAKFANSLIGTGAPIVCPAATAEVDYEAELAVVIGRRCRRVGEEEALEHVAGAMGFNDVSARDLQMQTSQWTVGKALDTFAPCGPALVLRDEIADLQSLRVTARLNGETMQDGTTADMIFPVAKTVAFLSSVMTLEPGDIIATGTPAGVGFTREPPVLLRPDDVVEVEIGGLGVLSNPVVAEDDA